MKRIFLLIVLVLTAQTISAQADAFITTWVTEVANETLTIPAQADAPNYTIDWGDGSATNTYTATQVPSHTYSNSGEHTVSFTGTFPHLTFGFSWQYNTKLKAVQQWGTQKWTSMSNMFQGCTILNSIPNQAPDLSLCNNLSYMFSNTTIFNQPLGSWNVSKVTDMSGMFSGANAFNQAIGSWNVSKVTNMYGMFEGTAFNQAIGSWDVSKVTNMSGMFRFAYAFNQPIDNWDVSSVTQMSNMFAFATAFNQLIGYWNVSSVTDMSWMFAEATSFNQPLDNWDVSKVTNMSYMFDWNTTFNQPLGSWDVSRVSNMFQMFAVASSFNQPIGSWNVSSVTDMGGMFNSTTFNQPIDNWDVSKVTNMSGMFFNTTIFNQPLGSWDVSQVIDMRGMFGVAIAFNQSLGSWNVSRVTEMDYMFYGATAFNQPIGSWNVSQVIDMQGMFNDAISFNQPIGSWDVSKVGHMGNMFNGATAFNQPIGSWDVSKVFNMTVMFADAKAFNQPLGSWNMSSVWGMDSMFNGAKLSTANYDNLLNGWASKGINGGGIQKNVHFSGGLSNFCNSLIARDKLIKTYAWVITDGGLNCTGAIPQVTNTSVSVGATGVTPTATAVAEYPLQWYTVATKGTASTTAPTVATTTAGVKSYWVSQKYGDGTESPRALVTVTVVALPATPASLSLFDGSTGVTSLGSYVGSSSVLKLSTIAVANATYKWTLPVGVYRTDVSGFPINDTSSTDAFINVKFSPTTLTTALVVGVQLVNTFGGISKTTKTLSLARKLPSTLTALALTTTGIVGSITKVGTYMGVDKDFTLTATAVTTQGVRPVSYKWVLPAGVTASENATLVSTGVYTSTAPSITVNFKGVTTPAITSLPINAYAVNGVGTSAAKVLTLTRALPKAVSSVTGSALVCNRTTGFNYTILASDGATNYLITGPTNSVVSSASNTTNTSNTLTTSDLTFKVVYAGAVTVSTKQTLTIKSMNGAGTAAAKSIALTKQVSCTTLEGISKVTPVAEAFKVVAYPNPATSVFTLDVNLAKGTSAGVQVYDMAGRLIEKLQIKSGPTQVGANYPSGTYILKVSQGKNLKSLQLIKR